MKRVEAKPKHKTIYKQSICLAKSENQINYQNLPKT